MKTSTKIVILVVCAVLGAVGLAWRGVSKRQTVRTPAGEPLKIGVVASFTGPGAFYGENIRKGIDFAAYEINKAGGVLGRPVKVIYEDDHTTPKDTVSAVQKLLSVDGVIAILGVQWDFWLMPRYLLRTVSRR